MHFVGAAWDALSDPPLHVATLVGTLVLRIRDCMLHHHSVVCDTVPDPPLDAMIVVDATRCARFRRVRDCKLHFGSVAYDALSDPPLDVKTLGDAMGFSEKRKYIFVFAKSHIAIQKNSYTKANFLFVIPILITFWKLLSTLFKTSLCIVKIYFIALAHANLF